MSFKIRPVAVYEVSALCAISRETFEETFAATNTPENLQDYMDQYLTEPVLEAELQNSESLFYFLEEEGIVQGYLKLNTGAAQKESMGQDSMELERIYIYRSQWSKGPGQLLLDFAIRIAIDAGKKRLWLGVWEHNDRALRFYQKNGFKVFGQHDFVMGDEQQTDLLAELML